MSGLALIPLAGPLLTAVTALPETAAEPDAMAKLLQEPLLEPGIAHRELQAFLQSRIPALHVPATSAAWTAEARALRKRMLAEVVFRGVPREWQAAKTRVEWGETVPTRGGYRIRKLRYEAVPGLWLPALLYEPEGLSGRVPAVLNVNGHVGAPGKAIEYEQRRCINLAKRGMLALHPEWLNCGELANPEYNHNRLAYLDLCGRSGLAVFYLAMRRGLDILDTHPHADRKQLAVTGLSGGGWQTIWLSALDERVAASAPNAGYIGLRVRTEHREDIGDLEQNPTDMLRVGDYTHLTAMLAPRPALLLFNEKDDCCFQTHRALPSVVEPILPVYALYERATHFRFHNNTVPGTHNYDQDNREQFYHFLNDEFQPEITRRDAEIPVDEEVLSFDALKVGVPAGNAGFGKLAEDLLPSLPRGGWERSTTTRARGEREAAERWRTRSRRRLAEILRFRPLDAALSVTARPREAGPEGSAIVRRVLRVGRAWTLPAVEIAPERPVGTAVVVAQKGRSEAPETALSLLARGQRVLMVDLALCGECDPPTVPRSQHAMMIGTAGERLLGVQVAQLQAVTAWASREFGADRVSLAGVGRVGAVIAAVAAALDERRVEELLTVALPASLKLLIEERVEYADCPELFCFGLLEQFDIREILGMAAARKITLWDTAGPPERVEHELAALTTFAALVGIDVARNRGL
jgi:dienelactone hydrolase